MYPRVLLWPLGPRALRVPIIGLTWREGLCPAHNPPSIGAFGANAGALGQREFKYPTPSMYPKAPQG